jgi:hypothetical protein
MAPCFVLASRRASTYHKGTRSATHELLRPTQETMFEHPFVRPDLKVLRMRMYELPSHARNSSAD